MPASVPTITGNQPNPRWEDYNFEEEFETPVGNLRIVVTQPHGFRKLVLENGVLPDKFSGAYTGPLQARIAKDQFIQELEELNAKEEAGRLRTDKPKSKQDSGSE